MLPLAKLARLVTVLPLGLLVACVGGEGTTSSNDGCIPRTASSTSKQDLPALPGAAPGITSVASFGANPGALEMFVHAPSSGSATAVVVALHGCTQTATAYASAGWSELADKAGLVVVYPQQTSANNFQKCFRWWDAAHTKRGAGEAASIAAMVEHAKKTYGASRAFVTGLSAGGAMTAVMLAAYPDLFEAGAVMAGIPYGCAATQNDAYSCMSPGKEKAPGEWSALLPDAARGATAPRVSIWHGDADYTVRPANAEALVRQWTSANGVEAKPTSTETVGPATHDVFRDDGGKARVERWMIKGMGHGVVLDAKGGCGKAGAFLVDKGLCSTTLAAIFFGLVDEAGTPTAPPPAGTTPGGGGGTTPGGGISPGDCTDEG